MYETFFGLTGRPFSPAPDPACFAAVESSVAAQTDLRLCLELGRGIAVLTAPAGLGKTLLCRRLAADLSDRFAVVFLPAALVPTRRALLQSILHELGHRYIRLDEQELRLRLQTTIRQIRPEREGLVLIVDEAHLLSERLLEELRTLSDLIETGEPIVRLLLSGHLSLEEKLASPMLGALGQRIGCHANLVPLTQEESRNYLSDRVIHAGGELDRIFTPEAVRLIARASDGAPRAINQLCEQSLLIAAAKQERHVREETVQAGLRALQQLPLHWNVSPTSADVSANPSVERPQGDPAGDTTTIEIETGADHDAGMDDAGVIEVGFDETPPPDAATAQPAENCESPEIIASAPVPDACACGEIRACRCPDEAAVTDPTERVFDREPRLNRGPHAVRKSTGADGLLPELVELRQEEARITALAEGLRNLAANGKSPHARRPDRVIDGVVPLIDAALRAEQPNSTARRIARSAPAVLAEEAEELETRIGSSVLDACLAAQRSVRERLDLSDASGGRGEARSRRGPTTQAKRDSLQPESPVPRRRYDRLFSDLRRRLRGE